MTIIDRDRRRQPTGRLPSLQISIEPEWVEALATRAREHGHSLSAEGRAAVKHWLTDGPGAPAKKKGARHGG